MKEFAWIGLCVVFICIVAFLRNVSGCTTTAEFQRDFLVAGLLLVCYYLVQIKDAITTFNRASKMASPTRKTEEEKNDA